ncbi:MAG: glycosyl hydrolase 108 family protein, partial [Nostoc sp.]|uniref:glycosyl hydrolase 108 family protein n=1 Tax=Nostoc sp. TaxID=1180 RepID=UPI002FF9A306
NNYTWWHNMGFGAQNVQATVGGDGKLHVLGVGKDASTWMWNESDNNYTWWHNMGFGAQNVQATVGGDGKLHVLGVGKDASTWMWNESDNNYTWWHNMGFGARQTTVTNDSGQTTSSKLDDFIARFNGVKEIQRLDMTGQYTGECVSLVARYLEEEYGKTGYLALGNGGNVAENVARLFGDYFKPANDTDDPVRGSIISFPGIGIANGQVVGHVAIVTAVQKTNGQLQVKILDSNGPDGHIVKEESYWITITNGNGTASRYGTGIYWTNPKDSLSTVQQTVQGSSADFSKALSFTLKWEGGYANNPSDHGGPTNKGITQNTYTSYRSSQGLGFKDVVSISDGEVSEIYRQNYWLATGCDKLSGKLAMCHFDASVNHGGGTSQNFLSIAQQGGGSDIDQARRYCNEREKYYYKIAIGDQTQFLNGWLNRLNSLRSDLGL